MAELETKAPAKQETPTSRPVPAAAEREPGRHPLVALRDEMDRLFDDFFASFPLAPFRRRFDADPWRRVQRLFEQAGTFPALDMAADEKEYRVTVELPGMNEKDIELTVGDDMVTVRGEKKQETEEKKENAILSERHYGSFERTFPLPEDADPERVEARFKNGVLTLTLARKPEAQAKRRKVEIKAA